VIVPEMLDRFLARVKGQALREGTRYALEARVCDFIGSGESVSTVVRGHSGDFEVALWAGEGGLEHRCGCPSWRDPCKHEVAAALVLKQCLTPQPRGREPEASVVVGSGEGPKAARAGAGNGRAADWNAEPAKQSIAPQDMDEEVRDSIEERRRAIEERKAAARREKLLVKPDETPFLRVESPSGFSYRVQLRGAVGGPHSCHCPDFEANRLHTCKHVERVRAWLRSKRSRLPRPHRRDASRPRIYLHFGEIVEPRLFGRPVGAGGPAVRQAFDGQGIPLRPLARDERELLHWLRTFGEWVEPEALGWLQGRLDRRPVLPKENLTDLLPPLGLPPYPYQWTGAEFLAKTGRALLADEMGLGKSGQAILAAAALRRAGHPARCVTIVCPASLRGGWQDEILRWLGEHASLLEGSSPERARVIASRPRWLITHYEQVLRDHRHHEAAPPDLLIVDEAQRAKGLRTRTARVLKAIGARYVFALTGTPLENRLEEAYAIAQLIDQRLLPPLWQLDRDHFVRDPKGRRVVLYRGLDALRSRLAPAFLRRRKEDVALQLPERLRSIVTVPMHPAVESTYDDVLTQARRIASKKVILPADLERIQRLLVIARRCCNGPHMLGLEFDDRKVPKLQELEEALRDLCLGEGRKAVVFSEWTDMTDRVEALVRKLGLAVFHLHGGVAIRRRPEMIRSFVQHKGPAAFVSTDSGGVGLNLQAADVVINLDLPWNPARLEQRIARVHRIGSKRSVQEILVVTKESIEESILRLHETKKNVLENIWARSGEDIIAAPGGSGSFREMVRSLLQTAVPATSMQPGEAASRREVPAERFAAVGEPGAETAEPPAEISEGAAAEIAEPAATGSESQVANAKVAVEIRQVAAAAAMRTVAASSPLDNVPDSSRETSSFQPSETRIDPAALSAAIAAVAPALPQDHRKSLATVFRALAQALEA